MSDMQNATEQPASDQPQFVIERIYLKDASFEAPNASVFTAEWQPDVDVKLGTKANQLDPNHVEVALTVTVTATNQGTPAYVAEVQQAGIFMLQNIPEDQMAHLVGAYCPNILFPYVREAISDLIVRGSFPQLVLQPVNFDAAFAESMAAQNEEQPQGNA